MRDPNEPAALPNLSTPQGLLPNNTRSNSRDETSEMLPPPRPAVAEPETTTPVGRREEPNAVGGLGLQIAPVSGRRGVTVDQVAQPSVGAAMGFKAGDRIISVNGALVRSEQQFESQVARTEGALTVKAVRGGRLVSLTASDELRKNPPTESAASASKAAGGSEGVFNGLGSMFGRMIGGDAAAAKETKDVKPSTKKTADELPLPAPAAKKQAENSKASATPLKTQPANQPAVTETNAGDDEPKAEKTKPAEPPAVEPPAVEPPAGEPKAETLSERIKRLKAELKAAEARQQQQQQQQ